MILDDGTDAMELVHRAEAFLNKTYFSNMSFELLLYKEEMGEFITHISSLFMHFGLTEVKVKILYLEPRSRRTGIFF